MKLYSMADQYESYPYPLKDIFEVLEGMAPFVSLQDYYISGDEFNGRFCKELEPYIYKHLNVPEWYGDYTVPGYIRSLHIAIYYNSKDFQKTLLQYVQDVFWRLSEDKDSRLPQNICFFRNDGNIIFGSVSHECIAEFMLNEGEHIHMPDRFEYDKRYDGRKFFYMPVEPDK